MRRRSFLAGLVSVVAAPLVAEAQQAAKVYRIGYLGDEDHPTVDALRQGLRELGYVVGRNIIIEYRWHAGKYDRLPALAADLVNLKLDLIVVQGPPATLALKAATTTTPIVFVVVADPVGLGLVPSLARPGGNITGFSTVAPEGFTAKQLELLKEVVPRATRMAVLINPDSAMHRLSLPQTFAAAEGLRVRLQILEARTPDSLEGAFEAAIRERADAVHVYGDAMFRFHRTRIAALAAKSRLPTMYLFKEYVEAGGLMSYGASLSDLLRRTAGHVDKILKGVKPGDLPIEQPTKFELVINMKTAKVLGLTIPQPLLLRADQVIQ